MTRTDTSRTELDAARDRVRTAEREAHLAAITAADDLWTRAIARTRLVKAALAALLVAALALAVACCSRLSTWPVSRR